MNKLIITSVALAVGTLIGTPAPAKADDGEVLAAIGGFIGGVIVGSHSRDVEYLPPAPRSHFGVSVVVDSRHGRSGHWEYVSMRTWVPGRWLVRFDDCGRRVRTFERGHYEVRRERVWVDARRDRRHDRRYVDRDDRHDRRGRQ